MTRMKCHHLPKCAFVLVDDLGVPWPVAAAVPGFPKLRPPLPPRLTVRLVGAKGCPSLLPSAAGCVATYGDSLHLRGQPTWRTRLWATSGGGLPLEDVEVLLDLLEKVLKVALQPLGRVLVPFEVLVIEWLASLCRRKQALPFPWSISCRLACFWAFISRYPVSWMASRSRAALHAPRRAQELPGNCSRRSSSKECSEVENPLR